MTNPDKQTMVEALAQLLRTDGYVVSEQGSIIKNDSQGLPIFLGRLHMPLKIMEPFCNNNSKQY